MDKVDVNLLIPLVKERPIIWDKTMSSYRNKPLRQKTWREICALLRDDYKEMSKTQRHEFGKMVLKKWTQIRDSCCKHIKKRIKKRKSGVSPSMCRPYKYYKEMTFLKKIVDTSTTLSRISVDTTEEENESESEEVISFVKEESDDSNSAEVANYIELKNTNQGFPKREAQNTNTQLTFTRNQYDVDDIMSKAINSANTQNQKEDHPNLHFFKGILPIVSSLSVDETLQFQSGVINLLQTIKRQRLAEPEIL